MELKKGLETIFKERKRFVIVGLTGRTGSGCSSAANILSSQYGDLSLSKDFYSDMPLAEQLRYNIINKYIERNWGEYHIIRIKDVITSFILESSLDKFISFCATHFKKKKKELTDEFSVFLLSCFKELHKSRLKVKRMIETDKETALADDFVYNFYFNDLPIFTNNLKEYLDRITPNGFTTVFQKFGNNVRTSGDTYISKFNPENIFLLAQRTNVPIKILRRRSIANNSRVLVAIDSIRNPYEASFFRERYASFYLVAITTDTSSRLSRLNKFLSNEQITKVDAVEYPDKLSGYNKFTSLNIQQCIQMADIHIYNPDALEDDRSALTWKLLKYIALINHPGLVNPSTEERLMQLAYNAKLSSGCISRQVGAVVTDKDYSVKAIGWNDVPRGQTPCVLRNAEWLMKNENLKIFSEFEIADKKFKDGIKFVFDDKSKGADMLGCNLSYCFKDIKNYLDGEKNQVHTRALHAEENAFMQISKYGGSGLLDGNLFTTASPCELCSKKAYQLGIRNIYYIDPYPGIAEKHILASGENRPKLKLFEGAVGRAYQQLFDPLMPNKDVVDLLINLDIPNKKRMLEKEIFDLKNIVKEKEQQILRLNQSNPQ